MKSIVITEAQFVKLNNIINLDNSGQEPFFQDGDFSITKNKMDRARKIFYPYYDNLYKKDKSKILHQLAFQTTMRMIDNDKKLPKPKEYPIYNSLRNRKFSQDQVAYVEKNIILPHFGHMNLEELYDTMLIDMEKSSYDTDIKCKDAADNLYDEGYFEDNFNNEIQYIAGWMLGRYEPNDEFMDMLWQNNRFTKKPNAKMYLDMLYNAHDKIAEEDDDFMFNEEYLGISHIYNKLSNYLRQ